MDGSQELELRRFLQSQRALTAQLLQADTLDQVASDFVSTVARLLRWEAGAIWEAPVDGTELRFVSGWSAPGLDAKPLWQLSRELSFEPGIGLPGRAWKTGEVV